MAETNLTKIDGTKPQMLTAEGMISEATRRANLIKKIVDSRGLKKRINNKDHVYYEAWSLVARFYGKEVTIDKSVELKGKDGAVIGYQATACLVDLETRERGPTAHSRCLISEANWKGKDLYAVESMAQTRAAGKVCRLNLGWVMVLAGYSGLPADEIDGFDAPKGYTVKKPAKKGEKPPEAKQPEPPTLAEAIEATLKHFAGLGVEKETIEEYFERPSDEWDEGYIDVLREKAQAIKAGFPADKAFIKADDSYGAGRDMPEPEGEE